VVDPSTALRVATVTGKSVTAGALSALSVMDASGATVNLGGNIGEGRAILVTLRHPG
jgi:UDP-N-acetylmuramoylalanine-D-glutamate ligase